MNQKKHLNAITALEASKDAEPGSVWNPSYCRHIYDCDNCYACGCSVMTCYLAALPVPEVRAALQSGLDAYNKRKAEKAERREEEVAIAEVNAKINAPAILAVTKDEDGYWLRVDGVKNKALIRLESSSKIVNAALEEVAEKNPDPAPLIPDPPDTPEVRAIMEHISTLQIDDMCGYENCSSACPFEPVCGDEKDRQARHAFALSWLSRHPAVWDAEKGPYPVLLAPIADRSFVYRATMPICDDDDALYQPATLSEVLPLIFDGQRQFADEARRQGWKR